MIDLDKLEELAKKAPQEFLYRIQANSMSRDTPDGRFFTPTRDFRTAFEREFTPQVALELIARIRKLEEGKLK